MQALVRVNVVSLVMMKAKLKKCFQIVERLRLELVCMHGQKRLLTLVLSNLVPERLYILM